MPKTSTILLQETLKKRAELYNSSYWEKQIPARCPPVLWFGDRRRKPLIITVGLNPSHGEFFRSQDDAKKLNYPLRCENRFYIYEEYESKNPQDAILTNRVLQSYDEYFRVNPYTRWFGKPGGYNVERFINGLKASFYEGDKFGCVHIDLFPFATVDKFSDLDPIRLISDVFYDKWFIDNFKKLVSFLDPRYLVVFGRSTTEYFNKWFGGSIKLDIDYREGGKKYASYGISEYTVFGKKINVIGLSVNLGNPRGFTKERLTTMATTIYQQLEEGKLQKVETINDIKQELSPKCAKLAFNHEKNRELAQVGDSVLSLIIREHYYNKKKKADYIQKRNERLGEDKNLAKIGKSLNLLEYIESSSGLRNNTEINEVYARTIEAVIGALYKEQGLGAAKKFVDKWIMKIR